MKRALEMAVAALLAFCAATTGIAGSGPQPGTVIANRAEATYFNVQLGIYETVTSNTVEAVVNALPKLIVTEDQHVSLTPDSDGQLVFFVENRGNVLLNPAVRLAQETSDDFDISSPGIYMDENGNGAIDPGEPAMPSSARIDLAPGERRSFIVRFRTPATVGQGDVSRGVFEASDAVNAASGQSDGVVHIATGGLTLSKRASISQPQTGEALTYTLALRNNGTHAVLPYSKIGGVSLLVDGVAASGVLVRDAIPLHTTFRQVVDAGSFTPLYHVRGDAPHSYRSAPPSDAADIDAVAFLHGSAYPGGFSTDLAFSVSVNAHAAGVALSNTAQTWQPDGSELLALASNVVSTPVAGPSGSMVFTDGTGGPPVSTIPTDANTFLRIASGLCNTTDGPDTIEVTITTRPEGDVEVVRLFETGANTGLFESAGLAVQDQIPAVRHNAVLTGHQNTSAIAQTTCSGQLLQAELTINPGGFVFNALTNRPVAGAEIRLLSDGGGVAGTVTSDADGFFQFENVPAGGYRLGVAPPERLVFPSVREQFPGTARSVDAKASYGQGFTIAGDRVAFGVDIPLDPSTERALLLDKRGNKSSARKGEFIRYELTLENRLDLALTQLTIRDRLPRGFAFVSGSARLDGREVDDPEGAPGNDLTFALDSIGRRGERRLVYLARVLTSAGRGRRTNTALARGRVAGLGEVLVSNEARWTVEIDNRGGVFSEQGVILGKVFLDCNLNEKQDGAAEPGISGVKIHTQAGRSVVTDGDGHYSLPVMEPVTHVLSVDRSTLPEGMSVRRTAVRDAMSAGSRFVDLRKGEVRSENFAVAGCGNDATERIEQRRAAFRSLGLAESRLRTGLPFTSDARRPRSADAQGELRTTSEIRGAAAGTTDGWMLVALPAAERAKNVEVTRDLRAEVAALDSAPGFIDLRDGDILTARTISVRVKGPAAGQLSLKVNGHDVPASQIGQRVSYSPGGVQAVEFVAIGLRPGANTLTLSEHGAFGNKRGERAVQVFAPGKAARLSLEVPAAASADPATPIPVVVRVLDANGRLSRDPMEVTLEARRGHWDVRDIRETRPGKQVLIDNGEALLDYVPPQLAGTHEVAVDSPVGRYTARVRLFADTRERVLVGIVEGALRLGESGERLRPLMQSDDLSAFERTTEGVQGALYLKGRIRGDALLTLSYDSDKDSGERLFRDVRPDEFYPVYGDSSERGFDAQSSDKLYVKVEKGLSYVLYGDIDMASSSDAVKLGTHRRIATGGRAHIEHGAVSIDLFAARANEEQVVREIRGRGTSGPYAVNLNGLRANSARVEIITRDRDQPEVVIETRPLTRLTDYTLDFFSGTILFDQPVERYDDALNPVYIRITYEADRGAEKYWIYGGEAQAEIREGVVLGYREVHSEAPGHSESRRTVRSGYVDADLGAYGRAEVEVAQTDSHAAGSGWGARAAYEHNGKRTRLKAEAAHTSDGFDVPGAYVSPGRQEVRVQVERDLGERWSAWLDGLFTRNLDGSDERYGAEARLTYRVTGELEVSAGGRFVTGHGSETDSAVHSGIIGARWRPSWLAGAVLEADYEQDFADSARRRIGVGAAYQYSPELRAYFETELSSSTLGRFGIGETRRTRTVTKGGIEYTWSDDVTTFSEYRSDGFIDVPGAVANGVRGTWRLTENQRVRAQFEHVEPIGEDSTEVRGSSIATGYSYNNEEGGVLFEVDTEWARLEGETNWFSSVAVGKRTGDITYLAENRFALTNEGQGDPRMRDRLRFGAAWRPGRSSRWNALAWYGLELDHGGPEGVHETTHAWSLAGTYDLRPDLQLRARHAGRYHASEYDGIAASSLLLLGSGKLEFDVNDRISLGLDATLFHDVDGGATFTGLGGEISFAVTENVLASVGYNHADLEEDHIRDIYQDGFYVRLRAKLDGETWNIFESGE